MFRTYSLKKIIATNMFWLFFAEFASRAFRAVLLIFVARYLGAYTYGQLSFATAFVVILSIFANFGFSEINTRQLSQGKQQNNSSVISLQWCFSLASLLLILILSSILIKDLLMLKLIWMLGVVVIFGEMSEFLFSFFRAINKFKYEALAKLANGIMSTGLGLLILFTSASVLGIVLTYILAILTMFLIVFSVYNKQFGTFKFNFDKSTWLKYIKMSWPLGIMGMFAAFYNYVDSVMMGFFGQVTEVGWYNAAYRIVFVVMLIPMLINRGFNPIIAAKFRKKGFKKVFLSELGLMLISGILIVGIGIIFSSPIINLIYGAEYSPAIPVFVLLLLMSGAYFIISLMYQILIVSGNQKKIFFISLVGMILNVVLNFILIPLYSLYGAAVATLVTYVFIMLVSIFEGRKALK